MPGLAPTAAAIDAWLSQAVNHERDGSFRVIRLDRIAAFLRLLPPPPAPCTVAGTKGKGSTVRLMECALLAGGQPTLAFTSPHVASVLERWRLDGIPADAALVAARCDQVAELERRHGVDLTYFERTFAVACLLAAARPGTRFLCEVGLGGRLDCANALDAAVAVVTQLSHDHRDVLGPTLHHIAREKLAIARPGRPLVIAPQAPAAALAIWRELGGLGRRRPDPAAGAGGLRINLLPASEDVWVQRPVQPYELAMPGAHQQDNAATAAAALRRFAPGIDEATMRRGFAAARLAARCQLVERGGRRLLVDAAHNAASVSATLAVAERSLRPGWRLLLGLAKDKEADEIRAVIPAGLAVERVGYRSPRARGPGDWPVAMLAWPWRERIGDALAAAPAEVDLCITGSFYLAGEALAELGLAGDLPG
jgi:dihydrofolate synthase/folylpolyglutamate synthase